MTLIEDDSIIYLEKYQGTFIEKQGINHSLIIINHEDGDTLKIICNNSKIRKQGRKYMNKRGRLTVISGPMACGKTLELIKRLKKKEIMGKKTLVFKKDFDTRNKTNKVGSRIGITYDAVAIDTIEDILKLVEKEQPNVIAIEEAQFFEADLYKFAIKPLMEKGIDIYITGLNQNFKGEPFRIMPELMAMADRIIPLTSICMSCHETATKTQKLVDGKPARLTDPEIDVGGNEKYEARCLDCWVKPE